MDKTAFIMYSGGLDSSYQFLKLCIDNKYNKLCPIFFDYGQLNLEYEKKSASNICQLLREKYRSITICDMHVIGLRAILDGDNKENLFPWSYAEPLTSQKIEADYFSQVEIENKNMVLYSLLVSFILSKIRKNGLSECTIDVYTGLRDGEMGDSSSKFFKLINNALHLYHEEFEFNLHFIENKTPRDILEKISLLLKNRGEAEGFIKKTASCYTPKDFMPCGNCSKCKELDKIWPVIHE